MVVFLPDCLPIINELNFRNAYLIIIILIYIYNQHVLENNKIITNYYLIIRREASNIIFAVRSPFLKSKTKKKYRIGSE